MNILVTGGAGFIGSNFVRMILNGEFEEITNLKILDKLTYAGNLSNLEPASHNYEFIKGDICDPLTVNEALVDVDAVINFAAESHVDRSIKGAHDFVQTNIVGVQVLLDAILETGRKIRFLQVSTDEVYGSIEYGSWLEDSPLLPNSPYSASKAGGELIARAYHRTHGLDILITRSSNNYGPYHFPEKLIPLAITNIIEGKKIPIYGNGLNVRDWLHSDDHCRGIYLVLCKGQSGDVYNIGGGKELSNMDLTKMILQIMKKNEASLEYIEDRKGHDFRYSIDCSKIKSKLGYQPKVDFLFGLENTILWYQKNESWWRPLKKN
jgi:dTDP-glucose 4,6-dehydratase